MAYHKREPSKDITSHAHATPLPTYYSQQLPRWTSKSAFEDQKAFPIQEEPSFGMRTEPPYGMKTEPSFGMKTEPFVPSYPQFAVPMPRFNDIPLPPRPQRQRLPRRAILIPWILAAIFFLTTLWFTSIALGVRLFMVMQPAPRNPPVQEIRVYINDAVIQSTASAHIAVATPSAIALTVTATVSVPAPTSDSIAVPTASGGLATKASEAAKDITTAAPVPRNLRERPTGFITIARMA
ncbi:hypothetical protein E8E13_009275 [Curvularia kusanoi]|uniref:Uncharacterized protein n=1 Tax=Curvularia kusanoi TaxID=90978 RepID=A0A9P4TLH6_CURKU|nr:hypothetical protein E8E13_009275 [Curvularia kusanoi]